MILIVATDSKWGIGKDNNLLFRLKKDMAFFRQTTTGNVVVMGANTFLSLPNGALPNRTNIVLDNSGNVHEATITVQSLQQLKQVLSNFDSQQIYVCGGASIYKLLLPYCQTALVTKVHADGDAQVFIPNLDEMDNWTLVEEGEVLQDGDYQISFCTYANNKVQSL